MSYRDLLNRADRHFAQVVTDQGGNLQCGRGCSFCCYGLFEIGPADVALLVEALGSVTPEHRARLVARAKEVVRETRHPDIRSLSLEEKDAWFSNAADVACPALGDDGLCSIYENRPLICRTFGLPVREGKQYIGDICELNFREASREEKETAAWDLEQEDPVDDAEQYTIPEAILLADRMLGAK